MPKVKFTILLILGCGMMFSRSYAQQDPLYSQYHFNQMVINPAYAGINNNTNITAISRLQWLGTEGSPVTNTLSGQTAISENKIGLGALFVQDKLGVANNFEAHFIYTYKINLGLKTLSFGLQTGIVSVNYSFDDLNLSTSLDPAFQSGNQTGTKPNFGTGIALLGEKFYLGVSVPRILNSKFGDGITSDLRYKRHFYGSFAYLLDLNRAVKMRPSILVRAVEGSPVSYDLSSIFLINDYWVGISSRNFESVGLMFQLELKSAYRLGYNFELQLTNGLTELNTLTQFTTHEFFISIDLALFGAQEVKQRYF